ncbi:hypothetical protein D5086_014269 [Populus alba]|uniref:Uncharacterized protein n=1 Tax=Populus alba TaxID=43335 RepID=A0ACC4BX09_POPAL
MTASSRSKFQISTTPSIEYFQQNLIYFCVQEWELLTACFVATSKCFPFHLSILPFTSLLKLMLAPLQDSSSSMKDLSETSTLLNMELDIVPCQFPITPFTSSLTPPPPNAFTLALSIGGPDSMISSH